MKAFDYDRKIKDTIFTTVLEAVNRSESRILMFLRENHRNSGFAVQESDKKK